MQILERIISEQVVGGDLVQAALSLIRASRFGLFESELVELLTKSPLLPASAALPAVRRCYSPHDPSARRIPAETVSSFQNINKTLLLAKNLFSSYSVLFSYFYYCINGIHVRVQYIVLVTIHIHTQYRNTRIRVFVIQSVVRTF